jgi:inositol 1,4,5-triphosphate receptor type 1
LEPKFVAQVIGGLIIGTFLPLHMYTLRFFRRRGPHESLWGFRAAYDLLFFFLLIIIVLNLIFGVIIDTFGELRNEKQQQEDLLRNSCFICGLNRNAFDNQQTNFEEHCQIEHCCWNYVFFLVYLRQKSETEYTGPESYVAQQVRNF